MVNALEEVEETTPQMAIATYIFRCLSNFNSNYDKIIPQMAIVTYRLR